MEFLLIASAHFLALISPGPDFFLILTASLRLPPRCGFAICFGIAAANGVYLLFAILGIEIIRSHDWLMSLMRFGGAAYLIFIGIMLLRAPRYNLEEQGSPTGILLVDSIPRQFCIGFMSAILNPKNAVFYLSLFTVMVSETTGLTTRFLYGIWMTFIVLAWDCSIVILLNRANLRSILGSGIFYIEKLSGCCLALFGCLLPFT